MNGLVEEVLAERYGAPTIFADSQFLQYRWNEQIESLTCVLYKAARGSTHDGSLGVFGQVYGDAMGGFLLNESLKLAMLACPPVYGLYSVAELRLQPEVRDANQLDHEIQFFMDAANVWFYGFKEGDLYVYDSEVSELTRLGSFSHALRGVLQQWEQAALPP